MVGERIQSAIKGVLSLIVKKTNDLVEDCTTQKIDLLSTDMDKRLKNTQEKLEEHVNQKLIIFSNELDSELDK